MPLYSGCVQDAGNRWYMKKHYEIGDVVRTLTTGVEGIIIATEPYFTGTHITYIVELCYGETERLGADTIAPKNDPVHIKLDEARRVALQQGYRTIYLAKDNVSGELLALALPSRKDYDRIAEAKGNITFYRELAINNRPPDNRTTQTHSRTNDKNAKVIRIGHSVSKVRILLHWQDAASYRHQYFETVGELAVFLRMHPELARAIGYVAKPSQER
jgi:hypothetical protein